jgi:LCP family protein required for cell wall assembly
MADGPGRGSSGPDGRDEPDFDWLYGRRDRQARDGGNAERDRDPTRVLPTMARRPDTPPRVSPPPASRPPVSPPPVSRPRSGSSRGGRRPSLRWLWLLLLLWVVFLLVVPLVAWSRIDRVDASPTSGRPAEQKGTTYLLVGSDSREGLTRKQELKFGVGKGEGRRTDSILLLHTGAGPNLLMSIPRDSLVDIPGHGTGKINAAFAYGGPKLLVRTIEDNTGIRVDDYLEIGFAGFVDVVDAVGGITICPKQAMNDPLAGLHVKAGCQHADGRKALGYARSRHTSGLGDIARAQHQREVVSAVGHKAVSPWSILNPVRYVRLNMAASRSLRVGTDTGLLATMKFAYAMTRVNGKSGLTCGVPISDLAVHWDPVRSKRLFRLVAEDRTADVPRSLCRPSGLPNA